MKCLKVVVFPPELYKSINSSKLYIITIIFNVVINLADVLGMTISDVIYIKKDIKYYN